MSFRNFFIRFLYIYAVAVVYVVMVTTVILRELRLLLYFIPYVRKESGSIHSTCVSQRLPLVA
jgi:hypothetical protein